MTPLTTQVMSAVLANLASAAARSIALAVFAAAALAAFRTRSVRLRLFLWKGVLLAALAMPAMIWISPSIRVAVPISVSHRAAAPSAPPTDPAVVDATPADLVFSGHGVARARRTKNTEPPATVLSKADSPTAPPVVPARHEIPWMTILFLAYSAITAALLARLLIGVYFSHRLVGLATPVEEIGALRALRTASHVAGLRAVPQLAESTAVSVPLMLGVLKPTILLTTGWQRWDGDELAAVLAHEISHVERRDALALRLALIHRAIFWFSPLGWWLERHLANLAEQASDEAALAGGLDRARYAEALLGFFARVEAGERRVWWQGVSMAKAGQAEKRVDRILAWRGAMSNKVTKSLAVALVAVATPVVALTAAVHPAAYHVQSPPATTAPQEPAAQPAPPAAPVQNSDAAQAPAPTPVPAAPEELDDSGPNIGVVAPRLPAMPPLHVEVPAVHVDLPAIDVHVPPVHIAVPEIHIDTRLLDQLAQQDFVVEPPMNVPGDLNLYRGLRGGYWVGRYEDWGPRFAIVTKDSDELIMSGDREDAGHARALKGKIPGDFIWFERDEKSYIIHDPATVDRAKKLWQPDEDLEKQQKELGKQQEDLAKQAEDAAKKIDEVKIKVPDLTAELRLVEQALKKVSAEGGTMNEIGDLQRQIGEMQRELGEVESRAGRTTGELGREQGEWGRKIGELGRQQGELARKQAELSREALQQMRQLLDDAVAKGLAKPE